jgi:hypothetical protein
MTRKKGNMTKDTFNQVLDVLENKYIALHHFGEPLLNHLLQQFIHTAKEKGVSVEFSTNGYDKDSLIRIIEEGPYIVRLATDSFHTENLVDELSQICVQNDVKFYHHSVLYGSKPFNNFAGEVEGESQVSGECYFKKFSYVVVLWDGRVVPCCCDYDAKDIVGDIWNGISLKEDYSICENCTGYQFADNGLWVAE